MARRSGLTYQFTLMLLLITWKERIHCNGLTVDPPENLVVIDPGHLGRLEITWNPPDSLTNMTGCSVRYQLEYFNTYRDSWDAIRTSTRTYSAQFDLMKDVRVRVYALLSGPCTNNTMIKSTNYTELIQKPPSTGVMGTEVLDFKCVFHNMEYTECKWKRSEKMPANSQQKLYYWHKELEEAVECPEYIISCGIRSGCKFANELLPLFTDINFCVSGSSPQGPLKPTFVSLQIQNHVKCAATEKLHLQTGPDTMLELRWEHPDGRISGQCLEYEVEHNQEGPDGKELSKNSVGIGETSLTLHNIDSKKRHCFRVRSKLNKYCASTSYWSEWSHPICQPEEKEAAPDPEWDAIPVYIYIAVAIIATLLLSLCVWAVFRLKKPRQEKRVDSLLTSLFTRNPLLTPTEA